MAFMNLHKKSSEHWVAEVPSWDTNAIIVGPSAWAVAEDFTNYVNSQTALYTQTTPGLTRIIREAIREVHIFCVRWSERERWPIVFPKAFGYLARTTDALLYPYYYRADMGLGRSKYGTEASNKD